MGAENFRFLSVGVLCTVEQKTEIKKQTKEIFSLKQGEKNYKERKFPPNNDKKRGTDKPFAYPSCFLFYASIRLPLLLSFCFAIHTAIHPVFPVCQGKHLIKLLLARGDTAWIFTLDYINKLFW